VAFSVGLILVVIAGAELFTGNNLIVMAWASRQVSTSALRSDDRRPRPGHGAADQRLRSRGLRGRGANPRHDPGARRQPEPVDSLRAERALTLSSVRPVVQAQESSRVEMDRAGYFVILPQPANGTIVVEHYAYDNRLLRVIEGRNARSIYSTLIANGWVTQLSHAAYLGKELARAESSVHLKSKYVQDGA
jgi:hypothetical protein